MPIALVNNKLCKPRHRRWRPALHEAYQTREPMEWDDALPMEPWESGSRHRPAAMRGSRSNVGASYRRPVKSRGVGGVDRRCCASVVAVDVSRCSAAPQALKPSR